MMKRINLVVLVRSIEDMAVKAHTGMTLPPQTHKTHPVQH